MDENVTELKAGNDEEYKVERIWDSAVYAKQSTAGHLPSLYYLISWKGYPKKKNTWEPALAVQHLRKLLNAFHKDKPNKQTATAPLVDIAPLMARPRSEPTKAAKQKRSQPATSTRNKKVKTS